jgi:type IV secretion system protein VirB9
MRLLITTLTLAILLSAPQVMAAQKLESTDDRIKTLVYDSSEVFRVVSRAGFQTTIEFNNDETIDTISIGDSIGWQLTPAGKRLFIKPLHKSGITNLSVITNRRSYQFELLATSSTNLSSSHSYVVKFYYPESASLGSSYQDIDRTRGSLRPVGETAIPRLPMPYIPPAPLVSSPLPGENAAAAPFQQVSYNYNYTMTGPDKIAPVKIYDNGRSTFFQFPNSSVNPQVSVIGANGAEYRLTPRSEGGMVVVDAVAPKMVLKQGSDTVYVYNESKPAGY